MLPTPTSEKALSRGLLDVLIRAGLVAVLVIACYQIFRPFLDLILWSLILAVTLYPLQGRLKGMLGNKEGRTATLIVVIAIGILIVPIYLLGTSMAASMENAVTMVKSGSFHIPPPADSVASWPLVGKRLYGFWLQAATDLTSLMQKFKPQIKDVGLVLLGKLAGVGMGLLMFIVALAIAGIFMAYGQSGTAARCRPPRASSAGARGRKLPNCAPPPSVRWLRVSSASPLSRCCSSASPSCSWASLALVCSPWRCCCSASCSYRSP